MLLTERFGADDRIPLIASDLAREPQRSRKRIMEAGSLEDLRDD